MTFSGGGGRIKTCGVSTIEKASDDFAASAVVAMD